VIILTRCLTQILLTGKAINFLRKVCQDHTLVRSREAVRALETSQGLLVQWLELLAYLIMCFFFTGDTCLLFLYQHNYTVEI